MRGLNVLDEGGERIVDEATREKEKRMASLRKLREKRCNAMFDLATRWPAGIPLVMQDKESTVSKTMKAAVEVKTAKKLGPS